MSKYQVWDFEVAEKTLIKQEDNFKFQSELWEHCFSVLSPQEIALLIAIEDGKSQRKIAELWNVSDAAISQRLESVRKKLKPFLIKNKMITE